MESVTTTEIILSTTLLGPTFVSKVKGPGKVSTLEIRLYVVLTVVLGFFTEYMGLIMVAPPSPQKSSLTSTFRLITSGVLTLLLIRRTFFLRRRKGPFLSVVLLEPIRQPKVVVNPGYVTVPRVIVENTWNVGVVTHLLTNDRNNVVVVIVGTDDT